MNTKNKKIFKRVGAGLMLGLSLLGLGVSTKTGVNQLPRKLKNFRQKEKEQLATESQKLLTMIENEAKVALSEEQMEQNQQDVQQQYQQDSLSQLNLGQKIFRYSVLGVWTVTAGLFFTSLVFNAPMTLGKKVLSALPGNPHTAILKLALADESKESDKMIVNLLLESDDYPVQLAKALVMFESEVLDFSGYRPDDSVFSGISVSRIQSQQEGKEALEIVLTPKESRAFEGEKIIQLNFETKRGGEATKVELLQSESLILAKTDEGERNILGKAAEAKFLTKTPKVKMRLNCYVFDDEDPLSPTSWQMPTRGQLLNEGGSGYWQDVDDDNSFVCGKKDGRFYLLFVQFNSERLKKINKASISIQNENNQEIKKKSSNELAGWEDKELNFSVFGFDLENKNSPAENLFIEFSGEDYIVKWPPTENFGRMILN